jgi:hypothetical protein
VFNRVFVGFSGRDIGCQGCFPGFEVVRERRDCQGLFFLAAHSLLLSQMYTESVLGYVHVPRKT